MTTAYTSLLGLALPVTGELSGTWGDTVNNSITSLLDSAIAGTTTITSDADVTLTTTTGSANTSRQAIILWTAGGTATRTIIAPAQSKIYTVINSSSSTQSIILAGAGPTSGVTIAKGESALCAWNGSDFIKISNTAGPGTFTNLTVTGNTTLGDAVTDTITVNSQFVTGTVLRSAQANTNTLSLAAYDVDGTAYTNLITLTAGNTPTLALTSTGVGTINNMSIGATTASTGAFTTTTASTSASATIFYPTATSGVGIQMTTTGNNNGNWTIANNYGQMTVATEGTAGSLVTGSSQGAALFGNASNVPAQFFTNNTVRATLDSSGNLGIGETNPTAKLQIGVASAGVNGTKGVRITNPAGTIVMLECGSGGDSFVGTESGSTFNIRTNNAINATFLTSGNVGIGETNPTQILHLKGSTTTYALAETTGTGTSSGFRMRAGAGTDFTLYTTQGGNQFGIYNNTTSTQPLTIDSSGNLGIGTTSPLSIFNIKTSNGQFLVQNGTSSAQMRISAFNNAGNANAALIFEGYSSEYGRFDSSGNLLVGVTTNASGTPKVAVNGSIQTVWGQFRVATVFDNSFRQGLYFDSTNRSMTIFSTTSDSGGNILFSTRNAAGSSDADYGTERARIDSSGNLLVGTTSGTNHYIAKAVAEGSDILGVLSTTTNLQSAYFMGVSGSGENAAASAIGVRKNSSTSRSINAAGTINASGADYAEYMTKAGDFTIAKGDVIGIDAQGKLTNVFADAVSFVVKSTNPSYVGGDVWGNEEALGLKKPTNESSDEEKQAFNVVLEAARQLVDRIAFSGQVPVNVIGATAGQYIIPVNNNGAIKGEAVSNPTFEQYQISVGKVIAIESNGRAKIIVKVA
jgi:hypothetical protein